MSKSKKKHTVKLSPGDSVVVFPYDTLLYLAETFDLLSVNQDNETDAESWRIIADEIRFQADENHYKQNEEEYWS